MPRANRRGWGLRQLRAMLGTAKPQRDFSHSLITYERGFPMTLIDIKDGIRSELVLLSEAAIAGDYVKASKHFDRIMVLTQKLGAFA